MSLRAVVSGVPGMYRSASSQLGAVEGWRVLAVAGSCLALATLRAGGRPRAQNALRHFAFSAWLAARYGEPVARAITDQHERHSRQPLDSEADQRNNAVGRDHGLGHPEARAGTPTALWRLVRAGHGQWREGRLWAVRHGAVVASP
ncbi:MULTISPECIES: DUF6973 domain-containing protein [unclassified Nocardioides]|uniref:DUF6973 domain-containing protein n=1 Tax=unclassified Nocardioides TaxID=2615069 RepID=UPI003622351B